MFSLAELAVRFGCEVHGDPETRVNAVGTLQTAGEGCITFLANPAYKKHLETTKASAVILASQNIDASPVACLVTNDPYATYAAVATELHPPAALRPGVHPRAVVDPSVKVPASCEIGAGAVLGENVELGERVCVGPNTVIGDDSVLGNDTRLMANVTLYHNVRIGERCLLHSGVVVGADGFGIAQTASGWRKVPQVGGVTIGNDVEIGAASTVDRGAIDDTCIGNGVKLDNLTQVGHNVVVGEHTVMAAQSGIAGSTTVGARCVIGGRAAISGHLTVCDDVYLLGRASVSRSISTPGAYSSVLPVEEAGKWRKLAARFKRLDEMAKKIRDLERNSE